MKKFYYLLTGMAIILVSIFSCENMPLELDEEESLLKRGKAEKVDVCHYDKETDTWETLSISGNALQAHLDHGDVEGECDNTIPYTFVGADYNFIIETYELIYPDLTANMATFGNFNGFNWTDEQILEVVGAVLLNNFPASQEGQQFIVTYLIYDGSVHEEDLSVILEGGVYVNNDNSIRYTLTIADISLISDYFITIYPGPAANVAFFGSFDRRSASANYWSDGMMLEAFNVLLDDRDPSAQEEQKYILSYVIYDGSVHDESMSVIKTGGVWVYQE